MDCKHAALKLSKKESEKENCPSKSMVFFSMYKEGTVFAVFSEKNGNTKHGLTIDIKKKAGLEDNDFTNYYFMRTNKHPFFTLKDLLNTS